MSFRCKSAALLVRYRCRPSSARWCQIVLLVCLCKACNVVGQVSCASPIASVQRAPFRVSAGSTIESGHGDRATCCARCAANQNCLQYESLISPRGSTRCTLFRELFALTSPPAPGWNTLLVTLRTSATPTPPPAAPVAPVTTDPVITAFNRERFYYSEQKGLAFNMLSAPLFAFNGMLGSFSVNNKTLRGSHNDEWLTAIGARFNGSTIALALNTSFVDLDTFQDAEGVIRMHTKAPNATILDLLHVEFGNSSAKHLLGSGQTWHNAEGSASVHFPAMRIPGHQPLLVIQTTGFEITILLEDAASYHLDVEVKVVDDVDAATVHGILGQTLSWAYDDSAAEGSVISSHIIDGDLGDYLIVDNLLTGVENKFNMYYKGAFAARSRKLIIHHTGAHSTIHTASWRVQP